MVKLEIFLPEKKKKYYILAKISTVLKINQYDGHLIDIQFRGRKGKENVFCQTEIISKSKMNNG